MDHSGETLLDSEVVQLALTNSEYFGQIVERYEAPLTRYLRRLGLQRPEDQEDVLQDVFIKIYQNLAGFDKRLKFSSWVYRIAHNETMSWFRKHNVRPEGHTVADSDEILRFVQASESDQEALFDEEVNAEALNQALQGLDEKYRTVLILRYFEHKEYEEISDILRIPAGSVGTLLHRGKQRLKSAIDPNHISV